MNSKKALRKEITADYPICSLRYMIYKKTARIMKSNFRCFGTMIEEGGKP